MGRFRNSGLAGAAGAHRMDRLLVMQAYLSHLESRAELCSLLSALTLLGLYFEGTPIF